MKNKEDYEKVNKIKFVDDVRGELTDEQLAAWGDFFGGEERTDKPIINAGGVAVDESKVIKSDETIIEITPDGIKDKKPEKDKKDKKDKSGKQEKPKDDNKQEKDNLVV